ncbi:hypothetical protein AB0L44_42235 [Nonomuraea wenchangensis]|uniref:hypothetical protein n=1 Tax=Nonomuraea wenchangensis TaxID=568860 RepID=UPI0034187E52
MGSKPGWCWTRAITAVADQAVGATGSQITLQVENSMTSSHSLVVCALSRSISSSFADAQSVLFLKDPARPCLGPKDADAKKASA